MTAFFLLKVILTISLIPPLTALLLQVLKGDYQTSKRLRDSSQATVIAQLAFIESSIQYAQYILYAGEFRADKAIGFLTRMETHREKLDEVRQEISLNRWERFLAWLTVSQACHPKVQSLLDRAEYSARRLHLSDSEKSFSTNLDQLLNSYESIPRIELYPRIQTSIVDFWHRV